MTRVTVTFDDKVFEKIHERRAKRIAETHKNWSFADEVNLLLREALKAEEAKE